VSHQENQREPALLRLGVRPFIAVAALATLLTGCGPHIITCEPRILKPPEVVIPEDIRLIHVVPFPIGSEDPSLVSKIQPGALEGEIVERLLTTKPYTGVAPFRAEFVEDMAQRVPDFFRIVRALASQDASVRGEDIETLKRGLLRTGRRLPDAILAGSVWLTKGGAGFWAKMRDWVTQPREKAGASSARRVPPTAGSGRRSRPAEVEQPYTGSVTVSVFLRLVRLNGQSLLPIREYVTRSAGAMPAALDDLAGRCVRRISVTWQKLKDKSGKEVKYWFFYPRKEEASTTKVAAFTLAGVINAGLPARPEDVKPVMAMLEKHLEHFPEDSCAFVNLAVAHELLGHREEAKEFCRRAISLEPRKEYMRTLTRLSDDNIQKQIRPSEGVVFPVPKDPVNSAATLPPGTPGRERQQGDEHKDYESLK